MLSRRRRPFRSLPSLPSCFSRLPSFSFRTHKIAQIADFAFVFRLDYLIPRTAAVLIGTVNDATTFPPPSKSHGSQHWQFERLLCVALVPLTATSFMLSTSAHPIFDGVLGATLVLHSHIGFDASLTDYLHKRKFPVLGPACAWFIRAASVGALWGVYEFNTNDVGEWRGGRPFFSFLRGMGEEDERTNEGEDAKTFELTLVPFVRCGSSGLTQVVANLWKA
ncbi:CybS-domain-containing protein [Mrakia frigida]|uniref:CybS family protein n=1 Tax=Mrakia frigida TaxID=29902 RepID=UPI003FCBF2F3